MENANEAMLEKNEMIIDRLRRAIPRFVAVLSVFSFGSVAFAQAPVDWSVLGASASTIINTGQTFVDIGTTLGRTDLVGVDAVKQGRQHAP